MFWILPPYRQRYCFRTISLNGSTCDSFHLVKLLMKSFLNIKQEATVFKPLTRVSDFSPKTLLSLFSTFFLYQRLTHCSLLRALYGVGMGRGLTSWQYLEELSMKSVRQRFMVPLSFGQKQRQRQKDKDWLIGQEYLEAPLKSGAASAVLLFPLAKSNSLTKRRGGELLSWNEIWKTEIVPSLNNYISSRFL